MILGFKGFKPGLIATLGDGSYQYQPGEVSKTEKAKCANTGFHYCLDPLDCLNWYAWDGKNEFWAIAAGGDIDEDDYRTRSSCTEIVPLRRLKEDEFLLIIWKGVSMFKVMQQYGTAAQPATVYYCDDEADLQNIKSAPMGAQALVIHTGNIYIADSTGKFYPM